jgi:hypothetical protein
MSEYAQGGAHFGAESASFAGANLRPMFEAAARTSNACGKAYLAWQGELLRFTTTRLQRDAEFGTNLLKCDKWADAARLQQSWVAATVEDYVSEANKLFALATDFTQDVAQTSGEQMRATASEVGRTTGAAAEQAGAMAERMGAEGVSRFARGVGEHAAAMGSEARRTGEHVTEESRKAAEDVTARERGQKRR